MPVKALKIEVLGRVQGVSFRVGAEKRALELGIGGWIKNNQNGGVDVWAEGPERNLQKFLQWCYNGSEEAAVESVESSGQAPAGYKDFSIIR